MFERSLDAAARRIEKHPRRKLFLRLIEHGPHLPDDLKALTSDGETVLSDPECGAAVEFIFSHMVNRFKGELAELLAVAPCIGLLRQLQQSGRVPLGTEIYWGETVQEKSQSSRMPGRNWGSFTKGADGLLVEPAGRGRRAAAIRVLGIVEVKSMHVARKRLLKQIDHHMARLNGGLMLDGHEFAAGNVRIDPNRTIRVMVTPPAWKLSRQWHEEPGEHGGMKMVFPELTKPPVETRCEQVPASVWKITLAWSEEALEQAAYEMTYGYMSEVGRHIYEGKEMPKGWEGFTPEEAGYNAIKMMLYYMPLRHLSSRKERLAIKLYNVYGFGYPLGVDSREMLWPEDIRAK